MLHCTNQASINRMPLNKEWFGLRDVTLCDNVGVPDCIFVHANGFIGK